MLKTLAGSSWGQDKETFLLTYKALGKSIASYATPIWSTNTSDSSFKKTQTAQNAALRTVTGAHKMASIDHLHQESLTLKLRDHIHGGGPRLSLHHNSRPKTYTHSKHHSIVLPRLGANRKETSRTCTHTR